MIVNLRKLNLELKIADIEFSGCNDSGVVWAMDGVTEIQKRPDVAAVLATHDPTPDPLPDKEIFVLPIRAPAVYADDIYVSSRDIKDNPDEAFAEALAETKKSKGQPKSLDLISRSTLKALEHAMKEIERLSLDVEQLKKKIK